MIRILALAVNPGNTRKLRIDKEFRDIQLELSRLRSSSFEFISYGAIQTVDLANLLQQYKPDILHFSGHGAEQSLIFEDENGRAVAFDIDNLEKVFQIHNRLSLVYFNSCLSQHLATKLVPYTKCIVGSTTKVADSDAIVFSKSFYSFLAQDYNVQKAFDFAKTQVSASQGVSDFILAGNPAVDLSTMFLPFTPKLFARFVLTKNSTPKKLFSEYVMEIFVHAVPADITEVVYHYKDSTISKKGRFELNKNAKNSFLTDASLYGDIDLRVTLWKSNGKEGIAIGGNLSDALENYYQHHPDEATDAVRKAIEVIKSN